MARLPIRLAPSLSAWRPALGFVASHPCLLRPPAPSRSALRSLLGGVSPGGCGLVLTEPYHNLPALREAAARMALTELGFASVVVSTPAPLSLRAHAARHPELPTSQAGCGLVVDAGFSFTHAVSPGSREQEGGCCWWWGEGYPCAAVAGRWQALGGWQHTAAMEECCWLICLICCRQAF